VYPDNRFNEEPCQPRHGASLPCNHFAGGTVYVRNAYILAAHMDQPRIERFLPLTPIAFEILLALAEGEQHGYSIMREVSRRSGGAVVLHPGTLYRSLARLLEAGLIAELDERPDPEHDDERRRYYELTALGVAVARAEAERLASQVSAARQRKLLKARASS
jgi:DNA-binding PadR family transcriptional regulator